MGAVIGLTFLFGFGNVWLLALRLGVPSYVAPLVAPAVDLSVLGLLLAIRELAVRGAPSEQIRPARHLLVFASLVTLALNVAEPAISGNLGKAAFDAVGPLLLIGWAEVGPGLLRAMADPSPIPPIIEQLAGADLAPADCDIEPSRTPTATIQLAKPETGQKAVVRLPQARGSEDGSEARRRARAPQRLDDGLLNRARAEDTQHWEERRRPISAETLRKRLKIGAETSRALVTQIRTETHHRPATPPAAEAGDLAPNAADPLPFPA